MALTDLQKAFEKKVAENKAREDAIRANPVLVQTPAMKKLYRQQGLIMFVVGIVLGCATMVGAMVTGRILIIGISAAGVFAVLGVWMIVTGTNPLRNFKK